MPRLFAVPVHLDELDLLKKYISPNPLLTLLARHTSM